MSIQLDNLVTKLVLDSTGFNTSVAGAKTSGKTLEQSLGGSFRAIGLGGAAEFLTITGAIAGTVAMLKSCYTETMNYGDSVRRLSMLAGITAEEASKVIQVADDYKISADDLNLASKTLAREGIALSIEALAGLSDEFKKIRDPAEAQAFLMANFGARGGTAFVEIMNAGGDSIRNMSTAISDNLILTQEQIDKQRELQFATDELTDALDGMKLTVGTFLVPAILDFTTGLNGLIGINQTLTQTTWDYLNPLEKLVTFLSLPLWRSIPLIYNDLLQLIGLAGNMPSGISTGVLAPSAIPTSPTGVTKGPVPVSGYPLYTGAQHAAGADYIIPPGFEDDTWPMFGKSGEHVKITPAGKSAGGGATNNFYITTVPESVPAVIDRKLLALNFLGGY
jgi:hypothetical protein